MTRVTKKIGERQQDLTNASHADILGEEIEQVGAEGRRRGRERGLKRTSHYKLQIEKALPRLLSSVKAFVTLKKEKRKGAEEAQENR